MKSIDARQKTIIKNNLNTMESRDISRLNCLRTNSALAVSRSSFSSLQVYHIRLYISVRIIPTTKYLIVFFSNDISVT